MKYLSNYIQDEQTKLFKELGVFFAFDQEQLNKGIEENKHLKPEGTKWSDMGMGMFIPSVSVKKFAKEHHNIVKKGIARDLEENGREGVLQRELGNYEIGLAYDGIDDPNFRDGIKGYGFSEEEIKEQYRIHMQNNDY